MDSFILNNDMDFSLAVSPYYCGTVGDTTGNLQQVSR
jgi:hypothetical protein